MLKLILSPELEGRALITLTRSDGTPVPFGSVVTLEDVNKKNSSVGVMGNNGEVYMSGLPEKGILKSCVGDKSQCYSSYQLPDQKEITGIFLTNSVCM